MSNWTGYPAERTFGLSSQALAQVELERRRRRNPNAGLHLWTPHPQNRPQQIAFESNADIIGYGGQAGGGKTDLLLGEAVTRHKKSVIFRREASQLRDIIERSREIIRDNGNLNESLHIWRNLPGGRSLEFGGIKEPGDINKWRGRPHDLKGFDEATEFPEQMVRMMMGWARSTDPSQICQTILTFNPPTSAEGRWVIPFFGPWLDRQHPNPAQPGELRWYARLNDTDVERPNGEPFEHITASGVVETIKPLSRTFIPASVRDNPYLANTEYVTMLQSLPEPLRSQLLYGDFEAGIQDDEWQVIPTEWVRLAQKRWQERAAPTTRMTSMGVDVARGGKDKTVFAPRFGSWFAPLKTWAGAETKDGPSVALLVQKEMVEHGDAQTVANIDVIGIGSSVYDHAAMVLTLNVVAVNWANHSDATDKTGHFGFVNLRAEHTWKFREALDPEHGDNLALPPDAELLADLTAPRYEVRANGIKVESKEDIKERIGRSPDRGDAVVLALPEYAVETATIHNEEYTIYDG